MKRFASAILLVVVVAAAVFAMLNRPGAEASPDATITVNSAGDSNSRDSKLTLREAIMLATGDLYLIHLWPGECALVSGAFWLPPPLDHCYGSHLPGVASADTIVFDTTVFYPGGATVITLGSALPTLNTGDDTVDGSAVGLTVWGGGTDEFHCFEITSDSNTIKGLKIRNCTDGVRIRYGAQDNAIGGSTEAERNVISGNDIGVYISQDGTEDNTVKGNFIGTNASGTAAIANRIGVAIEQEARSNTIGGSSEAERNVISGNSAGVMLQHTSDNALTGNYIGTNAAGDAPVPNDNAGVYIVNGAQNNTVGGMAPGEGNTIAFNGQGGVRVDGAATTGNTIRRNSIHSNDLKGIYLVGGGNDDLLPPIITGFGSVMGTACAGCEVDIYSDDDDEGRVYEGFAIADGDGNWSFSDTPEGPNVTATATDADGNTSEFSDAVVVPEPTPTPSPTPSPTPTATPSPTPEATRTVHWGPGWQNATWSGASTPEEAFACADGNYAAAYRLVSGGWERYFPGRPDISNMTDLAQYDAFLILITGDVTCGMPVADPPGTDRTLDWGVGWQNDGWTGADGTTPQDAFACADGSYAAAYRLVGGGWERYFPDRPEISNMGSLDEYDAFLILTTAPVSCTMAIAP